MAGRARGKCKAHFGPTAPGGATALVATDHGGLHWYGKARQDNGRDLSGAEACRLAVSKCNQTLLHARCAMVR
jgi:hypothetical protein